MQRALQLAQNGLGSTYPNPLVGSVIVYQNTIIGEGWHKQAGSPHAEANAIKSVKDRDLLAECRLYVNLEPCSHFGRTPPCSDLIIETGIPEVIIANEDPNPQVAGRGIKKLQNAGVQVTSGMGKEAGDFLNRRFFTFHRHHRPYVILKWAESSDGFMDIDRTDDQKGSYAISGSESRYLSHQWRGEENAILVGKRTVFNDNPRLNVRYSAGKEPIKVVIDPKRELTSQYHLLNGSSETLRISNRKDDQNLIAEIDESIIDSINAESILQSLAEKGIQSVIIEGGRITLDAFIQSGFWDEFRVFRSDKTLSSGLESPSLPSANYSETSIGNDLLIKGYNK